MLDGIAALDIYKRYPFLSISKDAKNSAGSSIFVRDVINERSEYVYMAAFDSDISTVNTGGLNGGVIGINGKLSGDSGENYITAGGTATKTKDFQLSGGVASGVLGKDDYITGYDLFADKDQVEIDFIISPSIADRTNHVALANDLISKAAARKDCVAVVSPARDDVVNQTSSSTIKDNIVFSSTTEAL